MDHNKGVRSQTGIWKEQIREKLGKLDVFNSPESDTLYLKMHEDLKEGSLLEPVTSLCPWGERIIYQDLCLVKGGKKDPRDNTVAVL